jgi:hypothetical protein
MTHVARYKFTDLSEERRQISTGLHGVTSQKMVTAWGPQISQIHVLSRSASISCVSWEVMVPSYCLHCSWILKCGIRMVACLLTETNQNRLRIDPRLPYSQTIKRGNTPDCCSSEVFLLLSDNRQIRMMIVTVRNKCIVTCWHPPAHQARAPLACSHRNSNNRATNFNVHGSWRHLTEKLMSPMTQVFLTFWCCFIFEIMHVRLESCPSPLKAFFFPTYCLNITIYW